MKTFFSSDHHFGHNNIIKFTDRPFESVEEMNEVMIQKWNEKIGPKDQVFHLGDFGLMPPEDLSKIIARLNGKIHLIKGNHEKSAVACNKQFVWVKDYYELKVKDEDAQNGKQKIILFHYAMRVWNGSFRGNYHLYGHSHGTLEDDPKSLSFDIGVDCHDFNPLSYEEVKAIMKRKDWTPPF